MKKKALIATVLLAAGLAANASAGPSAGDWEIVFTNMGAGLSTDGDDTVLSGSVRAGYFFDSNHELGGGASLSYVDLDGGGSDETVGLGGFYRYNWATEASRKWWYAGVDLDITSVTDDAGDSIQLRPHFGHKWMMTDDVSFDINLGIDIDADDSDNDPVFDAQWGITVFFK